MPAATYEPIFTYTVSGSSTNAINFSSVPQTYTTLKIVSHTGNNSGNFYWSQIQVGNGSPDTGSNYFSTTVDGNQLGNYNSSRYNGSDNFKIGGSSTANKSTSIAYLYNYTNTSIWKSGYFTFGFATSSVGWAGFGINTWKNTAAINYIRFNLEAGANFTDGSTITVYGIKAA
jgi:hypothetical protein